MGDFRSELEVLINRHSRENGSNTPDFLLATYLERCLETFDLTVKARDRWYGVDLRPGASSSVQVTAPMRCPHMFVRSGICTACDTKV